MTLGRSRWGYDSPEVVEVGDGGEGGGVVKWDGVWGTGWFFNDEAVFCALVGSCFLGGGMVGTFGWRLGGGGGDMEGFVERE